MQAKRSSRRGANAVEFALLLPVFISFLCGIIDMGWMAFERSAMISATTFGCREGALIDPGQDDADVQDVIDTAEAAILSSFETTGATCTGSTTCEPTAVTFGTAPNRALECSFTRSFVPLTGLIPFPSEIATNMVVRMEWQR
jgi:Flp pilus assembly protein TadG